MIIRAVQMTVLIGLLCACSLLQPGFETPEVRLTSFRVLPSDSVAPRFEIGLHVINPNRRALQLEGLTYSVDLEGHRVLSGVTRDLPLIAGYGEGDVLLQVAADLLNSLSLLTDLLNRPRETLSYDLQVKLDVGALTPSIPIHKSGEISLAKPKR